MSAPIKQDAAFRWTENGETVIHYLGAKLRRPVVNPVQNISEFRPADPTSVIRRIKVGGTAYELTAGMRFEGDRQSLIDFIAAARRGASLEYYPSISDPSVSFPCDLLNAGEIRPDADLWWQNRDEVEIRLRRSDGGTWQALIEAPLFYWKAGNAPPGVVFTRSGATARYVDADGVLQTAAANAARTDWIDTDGDGLVDTPTLLLEPARTNLVTEDDLTAWTTSGSPTVTGSITDPEGGTGAYRLGGTTSSDQIRRVITFTGDGVKSFVFSVREASFSGAHRFVLSDGSDVMSLDIDSWTGGAPDVSINGGAGTILGVTYGGGDANGDYWDIHVQTNTVTAASTNTLSLRGSISGAGSVDIFRVNPFNDAVPPTHVLDASGVLGAESWYGVFDRTPVQIAADGGASFYAKFVDLGTAAASNTLGVLQVSNSAGDAPRLTMFSRSAGGRYAFAYVDGTIAPTSPDSTLTVPSYGDEVELLGTVQETGGNVVVQLYQSINSGTVQTTGTGSAAGSMVAAFSGARLYVGSRGAGGRGSARYVNVKATRDIYTMNQMRTL